MAGAWEAVWEVAVEAWAAAVAAEAVALGQTQQRYLWEARCAMHTPYGRMGS